VAVQAFLAIRVAITNADGAGHVVAVAGSEVRVPAGGRASLDLPGRRATRLEVRVDGTRRATLVVR
jgi:hypothetical protein